MSGGPVLVERATMPSLGSSYARALARTWLRTGTAPRPRVTEVPTLQVRQVRPDASHLSAYQHLVGEPGTDVLPAGYCHVVAFPLAMAVLTDPGFPLPVMGLVHISNEIVVHRPVLLGEPLTVTVAAEPVQPHRRGTSVDVVAQIRVDDELVWTDRSTYLARSARRGPGTPHPPTPTRVQTGLWRVPPDEGRRYAAVSGDRNPIHLSRLAARAFGFPGTIVHGMDAAARLLAAAAPRGPFRWTVDFAAPILIGADVALGISPDGPRTEFAAWRPHDGRTHLSGAVDLGPSRTSPGLRDG